MKRRSFEESDLIRLNLQRLDVLTRPEPLIDRVYSYAPILPLTVSFILGILLAHQLCSLKAIWVVLTVTTVIVVTCLCLSFNKNLKIRFFLILTSCLLAILVLAVVRDHSIRYTPPDHITYYYDDQRELATLRGTVISSIRTDSPGRGIASIPWLSRQSSFYIEATGLKTPDGWQSTCGKIRVQVADAVRHIRPGNTVQLYCWLNRFESPPNPGQFDLKKHMHQRGVYVAASVPKAESIEIINSSHWPLSKIRSFLFYITSDALFDDTLTDKNVRSLASALLLGRRDNLNPQLMAAFRDTNLAHFISLSGMHVGILAGSLWLLLRTAGLAKRRRAVLCIILIVTYALIVPARAPTLRAVFLSCFFFGSVLFKRQTSPLNTLALSAMVLLFVRPYELFSTGWQLSFMSVLGIILFYPTLKYYFLSRIFYPATAYLPKSLRGFEFLMKAVSELLAVGLSVWITIAPILLYYFGRVNPLSWLWTLIVLPFVTTLLYTGFLKILFSSLFPTLAALLGWLFNQTALGFESTVMALSKIDVMQIVSYRPGLMLILTIYALMFIFCLLPGWYWKSRKILLTSIIVCFVFPGITGHLKISNKDCLEVTCLSVGHGQCCILSGPDNEHILIDAGSITHKNIANKVILPFLMDKNIFSLDAVYLSHGDLDHINAVPGIAAAEKIDGIFANQILLDQSREPSVEKELKDDLGQLSKTINPLQEYNRENGITLKSIWPSTEILADQTISENDKSEAILIQYANRKILFCGDVERYAQQQMMKLYPDLYVDVMILPHHGSTNNLDQKFVAFFKPSVVIASCSRRTAENAYRPSADSGIQSFYTATDGAVTIKIKADSTLSATGFLRSSAH